MLATNASPRYFMTYKCGRPNVAHHKISSYKTKEMIEEMIMLVREKGAIKTLNPNAPHTWKEGV